MKLVFKPTANHYTATDADTGRELATITEHGSLNWTGDPMKFDGTTRTRIMMFSAGIAHYYNSPDIMDLAQAYSY